MTTSVMTAIMTAQIVGGLFALSGAVSLMGLFVADLTTFSYQARDDWISDDRISDGLISDYRPYHLLLPGAGRRSGRVVM
jgi:hypothetical protein